MTRRWLPVLLLALIPLAACGDSDQNDNNDETPPEITSNYAIEDGSLLDPSTVSIGRVETIDPSWVVVFEGTTLLGHTGVDVGESTDVEVVLDTALPSGTHSLEAILYRDEGAVEQFEVPGSDRPILENGQLVATSFETTIDDELTPALTASDQTISSSEATAVVIDSVVARDDAWIVVRAGACMDSPSDGATVRGTRAVTRGEQEGVTVDIAPEVSDGETLCAYLHDDSPRDGAFTHGDDVDEDPPIAEAGNLVSAEFTVTVQGPAGDPVVEATDQDVSSDAPDSVTVDRVVSQGDGWLVIHRGSCSLPGEIVGHTTVVDGENTDVTVDFDDGEWIVDVGSGTQFCAMLHEEDPADDAFTYDGENGEDVPVLDQGGNAVADAFSVTVQQQQDPVLTVDDQLLIEGEVIVASVYVPTGNWLALYTTDAQGARDQLIGSTRIAPTLFTDATVSIDRTALGRSLEDGEMLQVAVHEDNPNDESFDPTGDDDPVATDGGGNEYSATFAVNTPSLSATDQTVDPATTLTIDSVRAVGAGWIAAYDGTCPDSGQPWGTRLGFVSVPDGVSTNVALTLDSAATDQQTICLALHIDDPADDTFENTTPTDSPDAVETRPLGDAVRAEITVTVP